MKSFQSIELISDALAKRGYSYTKVHLDGYKQRRFTNGKKTWISKSGYVQYPFVSARVEKLASKKDLAYAYVQANGFSIPKTRVLLPGEAISLATIVPMSFPLIVKPNAGAGSAGLTRNITNERQLKSAVALVHRTDRPALIQEQFIGQELRFTIMDQQVVSACLRDRPQLVGNGNGNISALLAAENISRRAIDVQYLAYPQLTPSLIDMPTNGSHVLAKGKVQHLGDSSMISGGASVYNVDDTVHESYKQLALEMVANLDTPFLVVDLLVKNYRQEVAPSSYVFLEFNTAPALKLYYSFRDGKQYDIVPRLAEMIDAHVDKTVIC